MNTDTGKLIALINDEDVKSVKQEAEDFIEAMKRGAEEYAEHLNNIPEYIPIEVQDITRKQKSKMQVSKYDNRSKLGKKYTRIRQMRSKVR